MRKFKIAVILVAGVATGTSSAYAGGWIADNLIKPIAGEHAAREADKIHENIGKPLDRVPQAVAAAILAAAARNNARAR